MKKYLKMSKSEYELIIKLVLCTVIATAISWIMGDIYSPTTAVTANLFLWNDRGYRGSIKYAIRRIAAQIVQGALLLILIFPCKHFGLPIPDAVLITVSCCIALCIGLPINYKHTYAPFNCTLANATFVIACATVRSLEAFPKRVFQCVIGALIGYFVNYIIFSYKDRGKEIMNLVDDSINDLIHNRDFNSFHRHMTLLEKEYAFVIDDEGKTRRKSKMTTGEIDFLKWNKELLEKLSSFVAVYEVHKKNVSEDCRQIMWHLLPDALALHKQIISNDAGQTDKISEIIIPDFMVECHEDLFIPGRLVEYIKMLNCYQL